MQYTMEARRAHLQAERRIVLHSLDGGVQLGNIVWSQCEQPLSLATGVVGGAPGRRVVNDRKRLHCALWACVPAHPSNPLVKTLIGCHAIVLWLTQWLLKLLQPSAHADGVVGGMLRGGDIDDH